MKLLIQGEAGDLVHGGGSVAIHGGLVYGNGHGNWQCPLRMVQLRRNKASKCGDHWNTMSSFSLKNTQQSINKKVEVACTYKAEYRPLVILHVGGRYIQQFFSCVQFSL